MPKLRREYTLRVLKNAEPKTAGQKNAEPTFPNLYSNEHSYSQIFVMDFFQIFEYFPIFSYTFLKKLKTISFSIFKFKSSVKLLLVREICRRTMKAYSGHPL